MCKEALMGAKENGAEIEFINLNELHLEHCTGCTACVMSLMSGKGGKCPVKDDFEWLRDKMMDATASYGPFLFSKKALPVCSTRLWTEWDRETTRQC